MPYQLPNVTPVADYLRQGYWADTGRSARKLADANPNDGLGVTTIRLNVSDLDADNLQLARQAFANIEKIAKVDIVEDNTQTNWRATDTTSSSTHSSSTSNGYVTKSTVQTDTDLVGDAWQQSFTHELLHMLGLGHAGAYNGDGATDIDAFPSISSWATTIMSYNDQGESAWNDGSFARIMGPQVADIAALVGIYGASDWTLGDTNHVYSNLSNRSVTVYDRGGVDTITINGQTAGSTSKIDLRPGWASDSFGEQGNLILAPGTLIENLTTGASHDTITGNDAANRLDGGKGNDILTGGAGADSFVFAGTGTGADRIADLGAGDRIVIDPARGANVVQASGGATIQMTDGSSVFVAGGTVTAVKAALGVPVTTLARDEGSDSGVPAVPTPRPSVDLDNQMVGTRHDDRLRGGTSDDVLLGRHGDDRLYGGSDDDRIYGNGGDDRLFGGDGRDRLIGGAGADRFYVEFRSEVLDFSARQGDEIFFVA